MKVVNKYILFHVQTRGFIFLAVGRAAYGILERIFRDKYRAASGRVVTAEPNMWQNIDGNCILKQASIYLKLI